MFFQFSPVRSQSKRKSVHKDNESEKPEILSLAPFTPNPKLFFENVQVGMTVNRKLLIENPTDHDVALFIISHIPQEFNVKINPEELTIEKKSNATLELVWHPLHEEFSRHMITIKDGKRIHRDVPVAFKSVPVKTKNGAKPKRKHLATSTKQKSPPNKSPRKSPTKKYYSTKPPYISPKRYSSSQKKYSPVKKYSPPNVESPPKKFSFRIQEPSPISQRQNVYPTENDKKRNATYKIKGKENLPSLLNSSCDSNVFVSPGSATFRLDNLQPVTRRETYVVNGKKDVSLSDSLFSDSLESSTPEVSPILEKNKSNVETYCRTKRQPLGISNLDNISPTINDYVRQRLVKTPTNYNFEFKLMQMESFCFTPTRTPVKQLENFSPNLSSSAEKNTNKTTSEARNLSQLFSVENRTFELESKSPNISAETYVKSNISTETYVKDNASFETYVKGNLSGNTFTKDASLGDVASLSFSPTPKTTSPSSFKTNIDFQSIVPYSQNFNDSARQVIEANLWTGMRNQPLCSIKEESYIQESIREQDRNSPSKSFLKRKSDLNFSFTPSKRPNIRNSPKEWSKSGGAPLRIAKKTTGLNLKQLLNNYGIKSEEKPGEINVILTKQDTNQIIIQNPYLLAATNLADPFMTPHLYINEEWLDQQQIDFKKWLNALLTPPDELSSEEQVVDVAKVWQECKKREVDEAPTKEIVSSKYLVSNKLNSLRKSAQNLFRSKEMSAVLSKVVLSVETGKLMIREDKDVHLNLALKSEVMAMLLSYNPLWLRIGLETIYNEIIPLKSNSDVVGLSTFIANRVLKDPYLIKKHKLVHSPKYIGEFKKFFLKKFLVLVYFLDQAKNKKLIPHDPCLFCKNSSIKESKEMLIKLAREMLAAIGDITKYLKYAGYVVTHVQTYIQEFDYAVKNLGVDLRDGVRLTKVMEIISLQDNLTSNLRVPAISRLQKIHNMKIVFSSLEKAGYQILYDISPKDIVDGHKEKTLSFLWQIIYKFQAPLMVKSATTIQTWYKSLPVVLKRRRLEKVRLRRQAAATRIQTWYKRQKFVKRLEQFIILLQNYLSFIRRERAAIRIQSYYKMYCCRKLYKIQHDSIVNVQRFAKGWLIRNIRRNQIKRAVVIQSYVRMYLARKKYLRLKTATNVIQARYRANKKMKAARTLFLQKKSSAITIQRWIRSIRLLRKDENEYQTLKKATLCMQHRFRANRLCKIERKRYLEVKSATLRIQTWYRSITHMRIYRREFLTLKKSVIIIEQWYIALKIMRVERSRYQDLRKACVMIQQQYKAYREMKYQRQAYLELKTAAITIQNRYRANRASRKEKQHYEALKLATLFVQRKYRATSLMRIEYRNYNRLKDATVKIQIWFRATLEMRKCLTYYISLKYAVHIFEERYQAKKLMEKERERYKQLKHASITLQRRYRAITTMREVQAGYLKLRSATVFIQMKFRANKLAQIQRKEYLQQKQASVVIQRRYRAQKAMRECRKEYLKLQSATVTLQRRYRAKLSMETTRNYYLNLLKYTSIIQRRFRANKAMLRQQEEYRELQNTTVFIQQKWRAKKIGNSQKRRYEDLKKSALFAQRRWRANKLCRQEKNKYEILRKTVMTVQRRWRAKKLGEKKRSNYVQLKYATLILQRRWRAKSLKDKHRKRYLELKTASVFLQRRWRSARLTEKQRTEFVVLKKNVTNIQRRWRANKLAQTERQNYLKLKNAATTLQRRWRAQKLAHRCKKQFDLLKKSATFIQRRWRANKLAKQERLKYEALKTATVTIQNRWRSKKLACNERCNYVRLKNAATVLQRRWRAKVIGNYHRQEYQTLKNTAVFIQRRWRANKLAEKEKITYETLRRKVIVVQRLWRANKLSRIENRNYLELKHATVLIQNWWRAQKIGKQQKIQYEMLREATLFVQRKWRGNVLAKKERTCYLALKNATCFVQSSWRRKQARNKYLDLKKSTITIQQLWRANRLCNQHRKNYDSLRKVTIFIQRRWRANKLARIERQRYEALRRAATILQMHWRAKKQAETDLNNYLLLKKAVVTLQHRWRANKLCEHHKKQYTILKRTVLMVQTRWRLKKECEYTRNNYIALRNACVTIQRRWRALTLMRSTAQRYILIKKCTVSIQRWFRASILMRRQRESYTKTRTSALTIQRYYRNYVLTKQIREEFVSKRKAAIELQRRARGYLIRRKYAHYFTAEEKEKRKVERLQKEAAIKIQAIWRGYRSRSIDTPELIKIRLRAKKATLRVEPQNTLGYRCRVALQALVNEKSTVTIVNKALEDLDYITRHSTDVCRQVAQYLPEQMYLMINTTNRSLPEMTACIFSVNILINVYKYRPTRHYSFFPQYIDNIITVMMHWCDKEAQLFPTMCTLLWLFGHNPEWKDFIRSLPNIEQRFLKIQSQILRKQSMVKRTGVKGQSLFVSYKGLPLPSLEPDWGLVYKHKPYIFSNSIHAFSSLLHILNL